MPLLFRGLLPRSRQRLFLRLPVLLLCLRHKRKMDIAQMILGSFAVKRVVWRQKPSFSPCDNHYTLGMTARDNNTLPLCIV